MKKENQVVTDPLTIDISKPGEYKVRLTPADAAEWLKLNRENRRPRRSLVEYLGRHIAEGTWQEDHPQPLVFSDAGRLIDGQHRLQAIVESKVPWVVVSIKTGCRDSVREYLDTGISRTLDDRVCFIPEDHVANKFASQIVTTFCQALSKDNRRPTPNEARQMFTRHSKGIEAIYPIHERKKGTGMIIVACAAVECYARDPVKAVQFYTDLFTPAGSIHAAQLLRDWLLTAVNPGTSWGNRRIVYRKAVYCMKAHLDRQSIRTCKPEKCSAEWSNGDK